MVCIKIPRSDTNEGGELEVTVVNRNFIEQHAQEERSILKTIAVIQVAETGDRGKTRLGGKRCVPLSFPLHQRTPAQGQVVTTVQAAAAGKHHQLNMTVIYSRGWKPRRPRRRCLPGNRFESFGRESP